MPTSPPVLLAELLLARVRREAIEVLESRVSHFQGLELATAKAVAYFRSKTTPPSGRETISELESSFLRLCAWYHALPPQEQLGHAADPTPGRQDSTATPTGNLLTHLRRIDHLLVSSSPSSDPRQLAPEELALVESLRAYYEHEEHRSLVVSQFVSLANTIQLITEAADPRAELDACESERYVLGQALRPQLLSALFRLAVVSHFDCRTDVSRSHQADTSPTKSDSQERHHALRNHVVTAVEFSSSTNTLDVQVDLPVRLRPDAPDMGWTRRSHLNHVLEALMRPIQDAVARTSGVFLRHGLPQVNGANLRVHYLSDVQLDVSVMHGLGEKPADPVPSASGLVDRVLRMLEDLLAHYELAVKPATRRDVRNAPATLPHLAEVESRVLEPCLELLRANPGHLALRKVYSFLNALYKLAAGPGHTATAQRITRIFQGAFGSLPDRFLWECLRFAYAGLSEQRHACSSMNPGVASDLLTGTPPLRTIITHGYSKQVATLLKAAFGAGTTPAVHVLQCMRARDCLQTHGVICEAAERMQKSLSGIVPTSVALEACTPDALRRLQNTGRTLLILGSNAVDLAGTLYHSDDHLRIAATANVAGSGAPIEVAVVTDGLKIGACDAGLPEGRQARGGNEARSPVLGRTDHCCDSQVPGGLINTICVLDSGAIVKAQNRSFQGLEKFCHEPAKEFALKLAQRVVATHLYNSEPTLMNSPVWSRIRSRCGDEGMSPQDFHWFVSEAMLPGGPGGWLPTALQTISDESTQKLIRNVRAKAFTDAVADFGAEVVRASTSPL